MNIQLQFTNHLIFLFSAWFHQQISTHQPANPTVETKPVAGVLSVLLDTSDCSEVLEALGDSFGGEGDPGGAEPGSPGGTGSPGDVLEFWDVGKL